MDPPTELAPAAMGELVDSIAAYNNSANAIGFSVYYYIDQMYSQPGLRLLAVDGVTPSNDTIASESYPLCNEFYAVLHADAAADSPERSFTTGWIPPPDRTASKIRLCSGGTRHCSEQCRLIFQQLTASCISVTILHMNVETFLQRKAQYGQFLLPCGKPLAHPAAQPHHSGVQSAGNFALRPCAHRPAAQRCAAHQVDARLLFDGNEVEIRIFLERSLDIVIGIEFIKMLAKHSPGSSLEVLLYAIARHLVVGHDSAVENLLSVGAIALIFIVRKFFFVPAFGAHLPDGHPAPDLSPKQSGIPAEEFISRLKERAKAEVAEAIPSEEETLMSTILSRPPRSQNNINKNAPQHCRKTSRLRGIL